MTKSKKKCQFCDHGHAVQGQEIGASRTHDPGRKKPISIHRGHALPTGPVVRSNDLRAIWLCHLFTLPPTVIFPGPLNRNKVAASPTEPLLAESSSPLSPIPSPLKQSLIPQSCPSIVRFSRTMFRLVLLVFITFIGSTLAATADQWRGRSIYQ